jgi:hypothetical protein
MTDETAPAVRIPNVTPGAVSGLDHAPLVEPLSAEPSLDDLDQDDAGTFPAIPEDLHNVDDLLGWVKDGEDEGDSAARAVSVLVTERESAKPRSTLVEPLERQVLDFVLSGVVIESAETADEPEGDPADPDAITGAATITTTGAGEAVEVEGQQATTEGDGEAVNAETGEVTQPGEPLPEVEGTGGTPLDPPQPGRLRRRRPRAGGPARRRLIYPAGHARDRLRARDPRPYPGDGGLVVSPEAGLPGHRRLAVGYGVALAAEAAAVPVLGVAGPAPERPVPALGVRPNDQRPATGAGAAGGPADLHPGPPLDGYTSSVPAVKGRNPRITFSPSSQERRLRVLVRGVPRVGRRRGPVVRVRLRPAVPRRASYARRPGPSLAVTSPGLQVGQTAAEGPQA